MKRWIVMKLRRFLGFKAPAAPGIMDSASPLWNLSGGGMRTFAINVSVMTNGATVVLSSYDHTKGSPVEIGRVVHADGNVLDEIAAAIAEYKLR